MAHDAKRKPAAKARSRKRGARPKPRRAAPARVPQPRRGRQAAATAAEHAATAAILRAISVSAGDIKPVFESIVTHAARLCDASFAFVMLHEGGRLRYAGSTGCTPQFEQYLRRGIAVDRGTTVGRASLERRPVQILDFLSEPGASVSAAHAVERSRTVLAVPLLGGDALLGVIAIWRREVRAFSAAQIRLLQTFADHAVIAIENARLVAELNARNRELGETVDQQNATSEVLKVISRASFDLEPLLQTLISHATRLCGADKGFLFRRQDNGDFRLAVSLNAPPEFAQWSEQHPVRLGDDGRIVARAASERRPVQIVDAQSDRAWTDVVRGVPSAEEVRTILGVPLLRGGEPIGAIAMWRTRAERFSDKEIELTMTFADQAVLAIENVRLIQGLNVRNRELAEALDQQTATSDVLKIISRSTFKLEAVLQTLVESATRLCHAEQGYIFRRHEDGGYRLAAVYNAPAEMTAWRQSFVDRAGDGTVVGRVAREGQTVQLVDAQSDPEWRDAVRGAPPDLIAMRTVIGVPLLREGIPIGVFILWRTEVRPFTDKQIELIATFADQAVLAIENVRLFEEIRAQSHKLELANTFKSRFLAAASHDLRQPLHALNLFVEQLPTATELAARDRLIAQIGAGVNAMNELFDALLDMSKLEAGVLEPQVGDFPVARLLERLDTTFAGAAQAKGLRLRVVPSLAWVRSDFILLQRVLLNLVSNAVRYTVRGGIVVGCRRRGRELRFEVRDSGPGIAREQQRHIFDEFYQLGDPARAPRGGLGLGLAIVDRLGQLLGHAVDVQSTPGRGSCFSVTVPRASARSETVASPAAPAPLGDPLRGKLVVVIDDEALVRDGMRGILGNWGCEVIDAESAAAALAQVAGEDRRPDLIISDYRLADGESGIEAIARLRAAVGQAVPAFLISGDTAPERLREAGASGHQLLSKPVPPMKLRAVVSQLLKAGTAPN
jgi:signal transduction histidine kinase